jgi:acyl-CoA reductase-like NAD-dependent aldehyde dehydrogenase
MVLSDTSTFNSQNPVTDEVITSYEIYSEAAVHAAVERARNAAQEWRELGFRGRRKVLLKWSDDLLAHIDSLTAIVSLETGKPISDAKLEVSLAAGHIAWAARPSPPWRRSRSCVRRPLGGRH